MKKLNRISHLFYDSNDLGSRFDFLSVEKLGNCSGPKPHVRYMTRWYLAILELKRFSNFRMPHYRKAIRKIELIRTGSLLNWLWLGIQPLLIHTDRSWRTRNSLDLVKASQLGLLLYNTRRLKDIYHDPYMCQNYAYRQAYQTVQSTQYVTYCMYHNQGCAWDRDLNFW